MKLNKGLNEMEEEWSVKDPLRELAFELCCLLNAEREHES